MKSQEPPGDAIVGCVGVMSLVGLLLMLGFLVWEWLL